MLLVRRGEGFAGAGDGLSVSGAALTIDAIVAGDFARGRWRAHSGTAQRDYTSARWQGPQAYERKLRNVLRLLAAVRH